MPDEKQLRWNQTPEGRKRMSEIVKKRWKAGAYSGNGKRRKKSRRIVVAATRKREVANVSPEIDEGTFGYALGYIESWLATYAAAAGVPSSTLAARVGKVLHSKARG